MIFPVFRALYLRRPVPNMPIMIPLPPPAPQDPGAIENVEQNFAIEGDEMVPEDTEPELDEGERQDEEEDAELSDIEVENESSTDDEDEYWTAKMKTNNK